MPTGVYIRTKEHGRKISEGQLGHIVSLNTRLKISEATKGKHIISEETRKKLSESHKGQEGYWKGKKLSKITKEKISESRKGKCVGSDNPFYGKDHTKEVKQIISERNKRSTGDLAHNWKGGITPIVRLIRASITYKLWRDIIFSRDEFTCQECGKIGGTLNVHHKKSFSSIMQYYEITNKGEALECEELWNLNNGVTLCEECHNRIHKPDEMVKVVICDEGET